MHTIKIFLASSAELKKDRKEFEIFIRRENKILKDKSIELDLDIWEDFIDAISKTRLQDEYNIKIEEADIFIVLFFTKVGKYTEEEFDKALDQFKKKGKPFIYTYFKQGVKKQKEANESDAASLTAFKQKLKDIGHFPNLYKTTDELVRHFKQQLDKLFTEGLLKSGEEENISKRIIQQGEKSIYVEKGGDMTFNIE